MRWLFLLCLLGTSFSQSSLGPSIKNVGSSLMMNMAMITNLDVDCEKSGMTVRVEFSQPFDGIIFSKGHYNDPECRYVSPSSGRSSYTFDIPSQYCGSETNSVGNTVELSNIIVFQNDVVVQEIWDVARHIKCNWTENFVKKVNFNPVSVGMLTAEEVVFSGDDSLECWMNIQLGSYPKSTDINSIVRIGDTLSLLVYIRDNNRMFDVSVKDCYAYGGDEDDPDTPTIQLTDEDGCVLKDKLISNFYTVREDDARGSVIVAYAYVQAFKFPDVMDVHMACNTEICKGECERSCGFAATTENPPRSGSTLFGEPIYTKAPTTTTQPPPPPAPKTTTQPPPPPRTTTQPPRPPAPRITTQPPPPPPAPKCYPGSFDPACPYDCSVDSTDPRCPPPVVPQKQICFPGSTDPTCPQPTTTKPKPQCYPGSSDPRCPQPTVPPKPQCYRGSTDPRCPQPTVPPKPLCYLGSTEPECQFPENEIADDPCPPGSTDSACIITKPPRSGSTLFGLPITTARQGSSQFPDVTVPTTRRPTTQKLTRPTQPSPSLKPKPSDRVENRIPAKKEPKAKPEPSGGEWEGESRFHAFHSYHYDKGDGRRTKKSGNKLPFGARLKREASTSTNNINVKKIKIESVILVAPIDETANREKRETGNFWNEPVESMEYTPLEKVANGAICMSFNALTFGLSILIFFLFITTSTSVCLLLRQRHAK